MLLKGLLVVIDDVGVVKLCREWEEGIMGEVRLCGDVVVVCWS